MNHKSNSINLGFPFGLHTKQCRLLQTCYLGIKNSSHKKNPIVIFDSVIKLISYEVKQLASEKTSLILSQFSKSENKTSSSKSSLETRRNVESVLSHWCLIACHCMSLHVSWWNIMWQLVMRHTRTISVSMFGHLWNFLIQTFINWMSLLVLYTKWILGWTVPLSSQKVVSGRGLYDNTCGLIVLSCFERRRRKKLYSLTLLKECYR